MRPGLLEELAGITERRWWPEEMRFDEAAALAGEKAIDGRRDRPLRDRDAGQHLGLPPPPRAVGRLRRPSPSRPRARLPQLRPRQRLPRLRQRDPPRRDRDRRRPDRLRPDRRRRGRAAHARDDDQAAPGDGAGDAGRLRGVREPDARLGLRGDGARQPRRGARRPSPRRRHLARGDPAPPDLHRRPRADDDRHQGAARGRARARRRRRGPSRPTTSAGTRTSAGTSSTRSARCTRA